MPTIPRIALVGRPNVGKSTLFNRICGRRKAITDARPGSTRDRNYAQTSWQGAAFELVDTGGLLLASSDPLLGPAAAQADLAITEADLVIFLVDARAGLLPDDAAIGARLRQKDKPILLAVNKTEGNVEWEAEFSVLGFSPLVPISAEHGQGVGDLLDAALCRVPRVEVEDDPARPPRVALVGRPNVGKSSLLNRLLGEDRALVSPIPGTTRDSVDSVVERRGKRYLLVDTAGIRRQRLLRENVDHVSVVQSRRAIDRCDVACLVLDATEGMREMDATIGGYIQEAGKPLALAVNKWDRSRELKLQRTSYSTNVRDALKFLAFAPVEFVSATSGAGLDRLFATLDKCHEASRHRVTTGQLNRLIAKAQQGHAPKADKGGKPVRLLYATQVGVAPPTFVVSVSHDVGLHFSYVRYLENRIRDEFGFRGTPIVIRVRHRPH